MIKTIGVYTIVAAGFALYLYSLGFPVMIATCCSSVVYLDIFQYLYERYIKV